MPRRLLAACLLFFSALESGEAQPLSQRGIANLTAFARLLALVRFFHPSDAVAAADWNRVTVAGVSAVEGAEDPAALAGALERFFRPLAPTLRVYPSGQRPEIPEELLAPSGPGPFKTVAWRHFGGHFDSPSKIYTSERIDDRGPPGFGTLVQAVAPGSLKGKRVRLRAQVRAEVQPGGFAQLGLRVDRAGGKPGFLDNMADRPIRDAAWRTYEIEGDVAPDAERIVVLLVLTGGGKVWLDDVSIAPVEGGGAGTLANAGFEEGEAGVQPPGWYFPYESIRAGYHLLLRRGEPCRLGGCAEVASDEIATPRIPRPEEVLEADLGGGVAAAVPLALWADAAGTLPRSAPTAGPWREIDPKADTREARLAAVALIWGIQQHFQPELDPAAPEWTAALPAALGGAAKAAGPEDFRRVLRRLLVPLQDTWTMEVTRRGDPPFGSLPVSWAWVEDHVVITGASGDLHPGDVVTTLDGRPARTVLTEVGEYVSAPPAAFRWLTLDLLSAGPVGSRVELGIERAGAAPFTVTLARTAADPPPDTPLPAVAEPRPGVVYSDLRRLSDADLERLLPRLAAARGTVFDLRGRTDVSTVLLSHLAERAARSANWQIPVVMLPDHRGVRWMSTFWTIDPKLPRLRGKVAFLIDGRTLHYSETLLEMVEQYRWAEIVGEPSGGDNGSRDWSELPGGWKVAWSGQRTLKHDGSPYHGVGVRPTVPASRTLRGIAAGRDEVVERAVEVVGGRP
ncbi:MAG: S41 family peptidase [Thermoanaerobaculia bacterium]